MNLQRKTWLSISILVLYINGHFQVQAANRSNPSPFEVKAVFDRSDNRGVEYKCEIINVSDSPQQFALWSCSYDKNWVSDHKSIGILAWTCKANGIYKKTLAPGEKLEQIVYVQMLRLAILPPTFRLGFAPYRIEQNESIEKVYKHMNNTLGPFWSNELETSNPK